MGRRRSIDQNAILDAAEKVVVRSGAAHLTLDAVALEAGISKASVIYDYKTKQQMIKAVLQRGLTREEERIGEATESVAPGPNKAIRGLIAAAGTAPPDDMRAVATNLVAALAQDKELHGMVESFIGKMLTSVLDSSTSPRNGLLTFLALEGLHSIEWHDFHIWPEEIRAQLLRDIAWLIEAPLPAADPV